MTHQQNGPESAATDQTLTQSDVTDSTRAVHIMSEILPDNTRNLTYAMRYAELGWHVFPLNENTKEPLSALGSGGFQHGTTDPDKIRHWWTKYPRAGIGLYPYPSGLVALDVDTKRAGYGPEQLEALEAMHGPLPEALTAATPSGARHLVFRGNVPLSNSKLAPDIDIRSENGYIVVEPSVFKPTAKQAKEGAIAGAYNWLDWDVLTEDLPIIGDLPQWVIDEQRKRAAEVKSKPVGDLPTIASIKIDRAPLLARLEAFLSKAPKARHRWEGGTDGLRDKTGSARDISMVALLKIAGFTYPEVFTLMMDWPHGSQDKARSEDRYWNRAWGRSSDPEPTPEFDSIQWADPADPFVRQPVPSFPMDCLPEAFQDYARELADGSGFDVGAYLFAFLVAASGLIDHRKQLAVGPMRVPPNLWGGLVAQSGGGKSPVLNAATRHIEAQHSKMMRQSIEARRGWDEKAKEKQETGEPLT